MSIIYCSIFTASNSFLHMTTNRQPPSLPCSLANLSNRLSALHTKLLIAGKSVDVRRGCTKTQNTFCTVMHVLRRASKRSHNLAILQTQIDAYLSQAYDILDSVDFHNENYPNHGNITDLANEIEITKAICNNMRPRAHDKKWATKMTHRAKCLQL